MYEHKIKSSWGINKRQSGSPINPIVIIHQNMTEQEKHGTSVYFYYFFKSINNYILCTKKCLDKI